MREPDFLMELIVIFLSWFETTFLISKYQRKRRLAYARWYKRQTRLTRIDRAGEEYWSKYPIPY